MQLRKYTLKLTTKFFRNIIRCLVFTGNIAENAWNVRISPPPFDTLVRTVFLYRTVAMPIRKHQHQRTKLYRRTKYIGAFGRWNTQGGDFSIIRIEIRRISWNVFDAAFQRRYQCDVLRMRYFYYMTNIPKDIPSPYIRRNRSKYIMWTFFHWNTSTLSLSAFENVWIFTPAFEPFCFCFIILNQTHTLAQHKQKQQN